MTSLRARVAAALMLPLVLGGCFTTLVWEDDTELALAPASRHSLAIRYLDGRPPPAPGGAARRSWTWQEIGGRLLLTPFAVLLDFVTAPVQGAVHCLCADEDEDPGRAGRRRR